MTPAQVLLLLIPAAYLAGSIPFGLLVGRLKGIDPRRAGSGNIGATNVGRLLGGKYFALVFALDLLKGLLPMLGGAVALHGQAHSALEYILWLGVAAAAILGHVFSVFLGFKGGKGVATGAGVALGLFPYYTLPALIALGVWLILFLWKRYVSVASIAAAAVFPIAHVALGMLLGWDLFGTRLPLLIFAVGIGGLLIYKHRGNIARLRAGTELRFGRKPA